MAITKEVAYDGKSVMEVLSFIMRRPANKGPLNQGTGVTAFHEDLDSTKECPIVRTATSYDPHPYYGGKEHAVLITFSPPTCCQPPAA